jgi:hypothetical protein
MQLDELLGQWKNEVKELFVSLNNLEQQKRQVNIEIKKSELGAQKAEIADKIKTVKRMIEQRRFEVSGLEKALLRTKGVSMSVNKKVTSF